MSDLEVESLYCHTYCPELNLILGVTNPTRHSTFLMQGINPAEEFIATRDLLARRNDPYVAVGALPTFEGDPVLDWILRTLPACIQWLPSAPCASRQESSSRNDLVER